MTEDLAGARAIEVEEATGRDALGILQESGIDVGGIKEIIKEQIERERSMRRALYSEPREQNAMMSELVYLMAGEKPGNIFYSELQRRLGILALSTEQGKTFIRDEQGALDNRGYQVPENMPWVTRCFIT
jgi:hypothetical protein